MERFIEKMHKKKKLEIKLKPKSQFVFDVIPNIISFCHPETLLQARMSCKFLMGHISWDFIKLAFGIKKHTEGDDAIIWDIKQRFIPNTKFRDLLYEFKNTHDGVEWKITPAFHIIQLYFGQMRYYYHPVHYDQAIEFSYIGNKVYFGTHEISGICLKKFKKIIKY